MGLDPSAPNGRPATEDGEAEAAKRDLASAAASVRDLPEIAKKTDDLEAIKKAVDDAAAVGGGLWLSYLFVLFYLAVAAGAVTHADLFFEKSVKLPFLGIELPLLAFFFLAPILFIIVHAYTLVHLVMLIDKAKWFDAALRDQIGGGTGLSKDELEKRKAIRNGLRRQLPSNIFIQFLAGPEPTKGRERAFRGLLWVIAWVTLGIAPVLLLLLLAGPVSSVSQQLRHLGQSSSAFARPRYHVVAVEHDPIGTRG